MEANREWIMHNEDRTRTTLIQVLGRDSIAVARAFRAPRDRFHRKRALQIVRGRMQRYLYQELPVPLERVEMNARGDHRARFEITSPQDLEGDELEFWQNVVSKNS